MRIPVLLLASLMMTACQPTLPWDGSLESLLRSQPDRFAAVMRDPARFRVQILYTQIDRDGENRPSFRSYRYRVDAGEYFYPASTVKLPAAALALEKIHRLDVAGLDRDTTLLTGTAGDDQTAATIDPSSPTGRPSVAHYIRKILLVSDNDAFNRLYEFLGQRELNAALFARGYADTRIIHRLAVALSAAANQRTNPVRFVDGETVLYEQEAIENDVSLVADRPERLGVAEIVDGRRLERPKDFAAKNAYSLQDQHDVVKALMFPDSVEPERRFELTDDDYRFLYRYMSEYPGESGIEIYSDRAAYPQGYVKLLMFGGDAERIPARLHIFNKVGKAYGFLTDAAYIVDFENKVEFLLAATIYTNENETFNDDEYEYEEIGLPFLRNLGQAIYEVELSRSRPHPPDLDLFAIPGRNR